MVAFSVSVFPIEELSKRLGEVQVLRTPICDDLEVRSAKGHRYIFNGRDYHEIFTGVLEICESIDLYNEGAIVCA